MRNELRSATQESHRRLDDYVGSIRPFDSVSGYEIYLTAMHRLYEIYAGPLDLASRWAKLPEVSESLRALISQDLGGCPRSDDLPSESPSDEQAPHQVWAVGYVLEGSAMGARHIVKQLAQSDLSHHYLSRLATDSHQRWPTFVEALESADAELDGTIAAAKQVFEVARESFRIASSSPRQSTSSQSI